MTFIILEGVDGSGKSTLAQKITNELSERFPDDQVVNAHHAQLKKNALEEYVRPYHDYRPSGNVHYVVDRHYLGEFVYGPLYRESAAISNGDLHAIELWLQSIGALVVLVEASLDVIQERHAKRGEDYLQPEHVAPVIDQFRIVVNRSPLHGATVDTTSTALEETSGVDKLVDLAAFRADQAVQIEPFYGLYIGRPNPNGVLVSNELDHGSLVTLLQGLPDVPSIGILNLAATEEDSAVVLQDFLFTTMFPNVVLLDDNDELFETITALTPHAVEKHQHPRYWETADNGWRKHGVKLVTQLLSPGE